MEGRALRDLVVGGEFYLTTEGTEVTEGRGDVGFVGGRGF
jgi:hypothetical protein